MHLSRDKGVFRFRCLRLGCVVETKSASEMRCHLDACHAVPFPFLLISKYAQSLSGRLHIGKWRVFQVRDVETARQWVEDRNDEVRPIYEETFFELFGKRPRPCPNVKPF